ncbi:HAD family hydrolase [Ruminococcus sp.]|uniref:HAD family hydrolase n=1 Tax=Ruminococcus sp. TaxID=41978 RepID=UPI0025DDCB4A|nr:HAD family hydrolase [Ruminococcus sp.]
MSKYRYFVFDFDLTLADSSQGILECFKHVLKEYNYPEKDDTTIYNTIGLTLVDAFDLLTDTPNNPKREEMRKAYVKKADEVMVKHTYFYDDTIAILQTLQNAGVKVGIVSTKYRYRIVDTFKQQAGSFPVDIVIGGEDVKAAKPDPQGLELIIERFGADKQDVLYIGDSYIDAETAQNAGVDFAGVTTGSTTKADFEKYPNSYIGKSLLDIFQNI